MKDIEGLAKKRLAKMFSIDFQDLSDDLKFSEDFQSKRKKPCIVSENEFDELVEDIYFVADKKNQLKLENGELVIETVGDYCRYMKEQSLTNHRRVASLLGPKKKVIKEHILRKALIRVLRYFGIQRI